MNQEIKKEWCDNLRSGKYKQGVGSLKSQSFSDYDDVFCCLGVLCDIYIKKFSEKAKWGGGYLFNSDALSWLHLLPMEVVEWAEISEPEIYQYQDEDEQNIEFTLARLNDSNKTFDEIAEIIEKRF